MSSHCFFARISPHRYSWFRLQMIAIHSDRRGWWTEHPHTRLFLEHFHPCAQVTLWLKCRTTCLHKTCSSTCHHMSERLLFPCFVFFLCLSCLSLSLTSTCSLFRTSTPTMSRTPSILNPKRTLQMRSIAPWRYTTLSHLSSLCVCTCPVTGRNADVTT